MVQAAFLHDSALGESQGFGFSFNLLGQKVWLIGYSDDDLPPTHKEDVDSYLHKHFGQLESLSAEDIELLLAKLQHMYGTSLRVGVVVVSGSQVLYGVLGGSVYFDRAGRGGWLTRRAIMPAIHMGLLNPGDLLVLVVDKREEEVVQEVKERRENVGEIAGWGLVVDGADEAVVVPVDATPVVVNEIELDERETTESGLLESEVKQNQTMVEQRAALTNRWLAWKEWMKEKLPKPKKRVFHPEIYIKREERKRLGLMVLGLFVVLLLSIGLGWRKRQAIIREEAFVRSYEPSLALLIEAEKAAVSNPLVARETLQKARINIESVLPTYNEKSDEHEKLNTLLNQVTELYRRVSGEMVVDKAAIYYDLHLVREDMFGERMAYGDGWVVILDKSKGILAGVDIASKQAKILAGGELLRGAALLAASTGKAMVQANEGLVGVFFGEREPETLVETDPIWENLGAMGMFGGNVYLVDRALGEIWQYPGFDGGLGERRRWFGPGILPDLSQVSAISVDGDIWMGMSDGTIEHYRRGAPLNVKLTGLAKPLGDVTALWVEYEKEDLFVLDKTNKRVVWFGKDGTYKKQYEWEGIATVTDMVIVQSKAGGQMILLLSGSTIYEIPAN